MEYYNLIIFIFVFLIVLISFYLIISNFGIKSNGNSIYETTDNLNSHSNSNVDLENKISFLKYELSQIKNKINTTASENKQDNTIKEIIIEQDNPNINTTVPSITNTSNNISGNKPPPIIYDPIANYDIAKLTDPLVDPRGRTSADQIPTPQVAMQFNFPTQGVLDRYHRVGLLIGIDNNIKKEKIDHIELPYSISDKSNLSNDSNSGSEFTWNGKSKTNINKKKKKFAVMGSESGTKSYNGVDIKENFDNYSDSDYDSDSDFDTNEYFGNTDKSITNVYNVYSNNNDNNILELIGKKITDNWYKYFTSITMGNKIIKVVVRNKNRKELYSGDIVYIPELKRTYRVKIDPMDMIEYNPYMF